MNRKHLALVSFAAACFTASPAFADAADTWIEYSTARGLPITATPSNPAVRDDQLLLEMSLSDGNVDRLELTSRRDAKGANGNGRAVDNGDMTRPVDCPAKLLREMARTDGNVHGDDGTCDFGKR